MKKAIFAALVLLLAAAVARAEDTLWVRTLSLGQNDQGKSVATSGTDIYVAGVSQDQFPDILVARYDAMGETAWVRVLDIDTMETTFDIAVGTDASPVVCARVESGEPTLSLVKLNPSGDTAWTRHITSRIPTAIAIGEQDAIYAWSSLAQPPMDSFVLSRVAANGALEWEKTLKLGDGNQSAGICTDAAGNVIAAAMVFGPGGAVPTLIKYSPAGDTIWTRGFGDMMLDQVVGVATGPGNVIVLAAMSGQSVKLLKCTPAGDTVWTRSYQTMPRPETYRTVAIDSDGNIHLPSSGPTGQCAALTLDPDGEMLWEALIELRGFQDAVAVDSDNRPIHVGTATEGTMSCLTLKFYGRAGIEEGPGVPGRVTTPAGTTVIDSGDRVSFEAAVAGQYRLRLYDQLGALVRELHDGRLELGNHSFGIASLAAGTYTLSVEGPTGTAASRLVRVR